MIDGSHTILSSTNPDADRAFLRDVLGLPHVDVGDGWLIFGLPPSEVAVHPSEKNDVHEFHLMCPDVEAFIAEMAKHDVPCSDVSDRGWGLLTEVTLPGGGKLGAYQPRHARPEPARTPSTLYPSLSYDDAPAALDWLERAFGFQRRLVVPGPEGTVMHSELSLGSSVVMVSSARPDQGRLSPAGLAGVNAALSVFVDDPDAHHARAVEVGANIVEGLVDAEYGARGYLAKDPEGHLWYFGNYRPGAWWDQQA